MVALLLHRDLSPRKPQLDAQDSSIAAPVEVQGPSLPSEAEDQDIETFPCAEVRDEDLLSIFQDDRMESTRYIKEARDEGTTSPTCSEADVDPA